MLAKGWRKNAKQNSRNISCNGLYSDVSYRFCGSHADECKRMPTDEHVSEEILFSCDGSDFAPFMQLGYINEILRNYGHESVDYALGNPAPSVKVGHPIGYGYSGCLILDLDLPQAIELTSTTGLTVQVDMLIKPGDPSRQNKFAASDPSEVSVMVKISSIFLMKP